MPFRYPFTVIGTPLMWCCSMSFLAVDTVSSGGSVTGSVMMPFSDRLTLSTSRVWAATVMFLWMMPMPALLGQGDGQFAFGDRVHRRREDGDIEADVAGERRADVHVLGDDLGIPGLQQDVVEGDALVSDAVLHGRRLPVVL